MMMRQGPNNNNNKNRGRSRSGNPQHGGGGGGNNNGGNRRPHVPNRNQNFDSNGPDVRIRGSAYQVFEKYLNLARDATAAGDRIMAESYYQHAEHYHRIINIMEYGEDGGRRPRDGYNGQDQFGNDQGEEGGERPNDRPNDRLGEDRQGNERPNDNRGQNEERQFSQEPNRYNQDSPPTPHFRSPDHSQEPQPYLGPQNPEQQEQPALAPQHQAREDLNQSAREEEYDRAGQPE